jgi:hypothetical protein
MKQNILLAHISAKISKRNSEAGKPMFEQAKFGDQESGLAYDCFANDLTILLTVADNEIGVNIGWMLGPLSGLDATDLCSHEYDQKATKRLIKLLSDNPDIISNSILETIELIVEGQYNEMRAEARGRKARK